MTGAKTRLISEKELNKRLAKMLNVSERSIEIARSKDNLVATTTTAKGREMAKRIKTILDYDLRGDNNESDEN